MTIAAKINQMCTDLTRLAAYYNEDDQYSVALTIQAAVVAVDDVANHVAEIGDTDDRWPPDHDEQTNERFDAAIKRKGAAGIQHDYLSAPLKSMFAPDGEGQ